MMECLPNQSDKLEIPAKKTKKSSSKKDATKQKIKMSNIVYVGHIPHGFYEDQMKAYFSQFGTISNIRLSRNKKVFTFLYRINFLDRSF